MADFLTTQETADKLGLSAAMVRHLERTKVLAALRSQRGTRIFFAADVEALRKKRAQRGSACTVARGEQ